MDEYISRNELLKDVQSNVAEAHNERCAQLLEAILNAPTADVVPRAELAVHSVQDAATILNLQESNKELEAEVERLQKILDSYALQYGTVKDQQDVIDKANQELASEIFAEIESAKVSIGDFKIKTFKIISLGEVAEQTITGDVVAFSDIAELKKKIRRANNEIT